MAIIITTSEIPSQIIKAGATEFELDETGRLIIKTNMDELLDAKVPNNKRWEVQISVYIKEYDA